MCPPSILSRFHRVCEATRRAITSTQPRFVFAPVLALAALTQLPSGARAQSNYETPYTFTTVAGLPPDIDATGAAATFNAPTGVAVDAAGNVYVADTANHKIRKISTTGVVTTLAGSGAWGSANGPGATASFALPLGLTVDAGGTVYVAEQYSIRKITAAGVVTTLASLSLGLNSSPTGVAIDVSGNLYVADPTRRKILKISSAGSVSTLAGSGSSGNLDGIGTAARFASPTGIAVDAFGTVYVADESNRNIRKITPGGIVKTLANLAFGSQPTAVAVDAAGMVYVADKYYHKILKITPSGVITILAGSGVAGQVDNTGTAASFSRPAGVAVDASGVAYIADQANHKIRKITPAGVVTTLAGSGPYTTDGVGKSASFNNPASVAVDTSGSLYVADTKNHKIRKITPAGVVTTVAGSGSYGGADGTGTAASFFNPGSICVDGAGIVYVAERDIPKIRKITPSGVVTTLAGSGLTGNLDGIGTAARFSSSCSVAVDPSGTVYVADHYNFKIRKITSAGVVSTLAGSGNPGSNDGTATAASFSDPTAVAVDAAGTVYVFDRFRIRKITPAGVVTTLAGSDSAGSDDGIGPSATFSSPAGLAVDGSGSVYVSDSRYNKIRKITETGVVTTLAGTEAVGSTDGRGQTARFRTPSGIAVDAFGVLYVADTENNTIRKGSLAGGFPQITAYPTNINATAGESVAWNVAAIGNGPLSYQWFRGESPIANATTATLAIPAVQTTDAGTYRVTITTSAGSISAQATLSLTGSVSPIPPKRNYETPYTFYTLAGQGPGIEGVGSAARFDQPAGVAVNTAGTVYVADQYNNIIRKTTPAGQITIFAGSGAPGSTDDIGTAASFNKPVAVAVDASGTVYVADQSNCKIRKITPAGVVTTLAGSGRSGNTNGIGAAASFSLVTGLAVDAGGTVYVADQSNNRIRKITPSGVVTTFAGSGAYYNADGVGTAASFRGPTAVAVGAAGTVYVADQYNNKIRKISPAGVVTTLAGSASWGYLDGPAATATFSAPVGVAVDAEGTVFVVDRDNHAIRKITPAGVVTTLAGWGYPGRTDGTGWAAGFSWPNSIAVDGAGTLYVSEQYKIRKITPDVVVTTLAGASPSTRTINGTGTAASLYNPQGVAVDAAGVTYVLDTTNSIIRKITPAGVVTTFAGAGSLGDVDGTVVAASLSQPSGLSVDSSGNIYVADSGNYRVIKITPDGVVTTLAGSGVAGAADGIGTAASFARPYGLAVDPSGNVYVSDKDNHNIRKISPTGVVTTFAGSGTWGSNDGIGTSASFYDPTGVAVDALGSVYIADRYAIRKITTNGVVTTLAGSGTAGSADGAGKSASFAFATGLAVDAFGNVYVADEYNHKIRKVTPNGEVSTVAGLLEGASSADGSGPAVGFRRPRGIAIDSAGILYVADSGNNLIRKGSILDGFPQISEYPSNLVVIAGQSATFRVTAFGTAPLSYQWSKDSNEIASATGATLTVPSVQGTDVATYRVKITNSVGSVSAEATLSLPVAPSITTQPQGQAVARGQTATFSIFATGSPAPSYQWFQGSTLLVGQTEPTITLTNVQAADVGNYSVRVTNVAGSISSSIAPLVLATPPVITTQPISITLSAGQTFPLSVTVSGIVTGLNPYTYKWYRGGLLLRDMTGLYSDTLSISNAQAKDSGAYTVSITNVAGSVTSAVATVTVIPATPQISAAPAARSVNLGQPVTFTVGVQGSAPFTYQWRRNGSILSGQTAATLAFGSAQIADTAVYSVTVSNSFGSTTSTGASLTVLPIPPNDHFANSEVISGASSTVVGTNVAATGEPSEPSGSLSSIWYRWTPTASGRAQIDTIGSSFDTLFFIYTGSTLDVLTQLAYSDDAGGYATGLVTLDVSAGTTYHIAVTGYNNVRGNVNLNVSLAGAPIIANTGLLTGTLSTPYFGYTISASGAPTSYSATGLPPGLSLNPANGRITGTPLQVGTFSVVLGATNAIGTAQVKRSFVIVKAPLTVRAAHQRRFVGEPNPPLTFTLEGFVGTDSSAVVTGAPTLSTAANATSPAGTYVISVTTGTLVSDNYTFSIVPGTLDVVGWTFADWQARHFVGADLMNVARSGINADPDNDGLANLLEYAFARDPQVHDADEAMANAVTDASLALGYPCRRDVVDLVYLPEVSGDLMNWQSGAAVLEPQAVGVLDTWLDWVTVRDRAKLSAEAGPRFLRLRVELRNLATP